MNAAALRARSARAAGGALALVPDIAAAVVMGLAFISGLPGKVEIPYWYLSYSQGFIRRALVGTLTMPFLVGRPFGEALHTIAAICATADVMLIGALTLLLRASRMRLLEPVPIAFLASGALTWIGRDFGFLDVFVELLSLAACVLLYRRNAAGVVLCALVPLAHEGGLFLLLPLLGGLFLLRPSSRPLVVAGIAVAAAAMTALWFCSTANFAWPPGMPQFDPAGLEGFRRWQLGQHLVFAWPTIGPQASIPVVACLVMSAATAYRCGWFAAAVVLSGTLFTWSPILIAVDTARLLAWGPLTAVVLAGLALKTAAPAGPHRSVVAPARAHPETATARR